MKKHAILMTAYCHPHLINRMLDEYSPHFDFYIHIDKKSALSADALHLSDNVTVIKELNVNWGGVNHLRAFLRLIAGYAEDPDPDQWDHQKNYAFFA